MPGNFTALLPSKCQHLHSPIVWACDAVLSISLARIANVGKIHWRNTLEQLNIVGPKSLGVCLLTSAFIGMVFTIQFIR